MKKILLTFSIAAFFVSCGTKATIDDLAISNPINVNIDLTAVTEDKVPVIINPGRFTTESVTFRLPKVVQGTYSVSDFGKYLENFKAYDYDGNEMPATKANTNTWIIVNATKLDKITYLVNDTFDQEETGGIGEEVPFSPAGTNIESTNYVLNLHGFVGYFDSLKNNQYTLDMISPENFVRTSALQEIKSETANGKTTTSFFAPRYFDITDNPMFYGELDVEEFMVGGIKIVLSVYSPNKVHSAASLKETMYKMMQGQKAYLGAVNSTPRYDIYLYLSDTEKEGSPKGFGALEHHTSTVVVLPENSTKEELDDSMIDVVAHEFFHIVTPLSVHSEDVHYFDYIQPTFSKHLWMYEGVTEYFAQHFQVYEGLVEPNQFYKTIYQKINTSQNQLDDTMSFTKMSENILDEPYASQYYNVYMKGALIGMCIDILMREESNGNRSMLSLMKELSAKYGKNKPFVDDNLIAEITEITYPSVDEFLNTHVVGETPINYEAFFAKVGLGYAEGKTETSYIMNGGTIIVSANPMNQTIFFTEEVEKNSFWKDNGAKFEDVISEINGKKVTLETANDIFSEVFGWKPGQEIEVKLLRKGKEVVIKTTTTQSFTMGKSIQTMDTATDAQIALRNAWLKG